MAYTTIDKPSDYFETVLYTGDGGSSRGVTGVGFQPDWVWIKNRDQGNSHHIYDVIRGTTKRLASNNTNAEETVSNGLTAFGSDGFTVGDSGAVNGSSEKLVSWNWKAGTSFTNDASATGIGTIDSTGSVNTDAGFSIMSYTGTGSVETFAHGLNSAPELVILRNRAVSSSWWTWGGLLGNVNIMELQSSAAKYNPNGNYHNDTMPTSSVISIGSDGQVSGSGQSHISYAFHSVKGYSKVGTYTGNGNADGTFVYTGFKPAFVIRKVTSASSDWLMQDNKRSESGGFNQIRNYLFPNSSQAEVSNQDYFNIDFLSNGFKMRSTDGGANGSGSSYIYLAFAESPFVNSNGVPNNAR